ERAGIAARGRELEAQRLEAEGAMQQSLTGLAGLEGRRAAGLEARQQFGTLFPELGPVESIYGTQENIQKRLAQIETEAEQARQIKDMDALLRLQRERETLESRVETKPSAFEQRQDVEKQIAYYQNLEAQLNAELSAASTVTEYEALSRKLKAVQDQRRLAADKLEQNNNLRVTERRLLTDIVKAREENDGAKLVRLIERLKKVREQLGETSDQLSTVPAAQGDLFSEEAAARQQLFDSKQRRHIKAAEARAGQVGAEPIEMGFNPQLFTTPPLAPRDYLQGALFGPEERVAVPTRTELTIPQIQSTAARLGERTDLAPEDQALLERVENVAVPAPGVKIPEALQTRLTALQRVRQKIEQQLLQRFAPVV
ncbi:hypothetical protein EBT31_21950, partial [bacterium]|nr:hypothetical protein [bacterium]